MGADTRCSLSALLPRYVDPGAGTPAAQMVLLGALFCLITVAFDSAWAMAAAHAWLWMATDPRRIGASSVIGGLVMISLGLVLATSGR